MQQIRKEEEQKLAQELEKEKNERELQLAKELKQKEDAQKTEKGNDLKNSTSALFAPFAKNCVPFSSKTEWFWLYGNMPFSEPDWKTLLPKEQKTVMIRHTSDWKDTLTTILVGTLTSISRKTRIIEVCEAEPMTKEPAGEPSAQNL